MKKVVGYANAWSVMPGDTLSVMVSTYGPERYRADLVRVICGDDDPDHGIYREEEIAAPFNGEYPGRTQPTVAGSYVIVSDVPSIAAPGSFAVQAWVFPTTPDRGEQGLIANWSGETSSGFALLIDATGALVLDPVPEHGNTVQEPEHVPQDRARLRAIGRHDHNRGYFPRRQVLLPVAEARHVY